MRIFQNVAICFFLVPGILYGQVESASLQPLQEFVGQVYDFQSSDMVFVVEKFYKDELNSLLKINEERSIPIHIFDLNFLVQDSKKYLTRTCPVYRPYEGVGVSPDHEQMKQNDAIIPKSKQSKSIFFMGSPSDLSKPLEVVNNSLWICPQKIDLGIFGENSKLFFFASDKIQLNSIMEHSYLHHHPSAYLVKDMMKSASSDRRFFIYCSLPCNAAHYSGNFGYISDISKQTVPAIKNLLEPPLNFHGEDLVAAGFSFAYKPATFYRASNISLARQKYIPDINILMSLRRHLNYSYAYYNVNFGGSVFVNNEYVGPRGYLVRREVSVMFGLLMQDFPTNQFARFAQIYGDRLYVHWKMYSPLAQPKAKTFIVIKPFEWQLWLALGISFVLASVGIKIIASLENSCKNVDLGKFSSWGESFWYCIGTFCAEQIIDSNVAKPSRKLRGTILIWLFLCFLLGAAYSGSLHSFLSSPEKQIPVETIEDALESNLNVSWILFSSLNETQKIVDELPFEDVKALFKKAGKIPLSAANIVETLTNVVKGENIVIGGSLTLDSYVYRQFKGQNSISNIHQPKTLVYFFDPSFATPAFPVISRHGQRLNICFNWLNAGGIFNKGLERRDNWSRSEHLRKGGNIPLVKQRESFEAFSLWDMQGIFYAFIIFLVVSLLSLAIEKCISWKK